MKYSQYRDTVKNQLKAAKKKEKENVRLQASRKNVKGLSNY